MSDRWIEVDEWVPEDSRTVITTYVDTAAWAPPTPEDYALTALALYAMAATVAVIGVTLWGWARGRGR